MPNHDRHQCWRIPAKRAVLPRKYHSNGRSDKVWAISFVRRPYFRSLVRGPKDTWLVHVSLDATEIGAIPNTAGIQLRWQAVGIH